MISFFIALVMFTNTARVTPLTVDVALSARAQARAEQLCRDKQWSHAGWKNSFIGMKGPYFGENLAKGFVDATSTHKALMASPTHKANITNKNYKYIGVGRACDITVELFRN